MVLEFVCIGLAFVAGGIVDSLYETKLLKQVKAEKEGLEEKVAGFKLIISNLEAKAAVAENVVVRDEKAVSADINNLINKI